MLGQDDISDAYYPYGRNNMMEVAFLATHMLWMTGRGEIEKLYDMATAPAAAINLPDFGLRPGPMPTSSCTAIPTWSKRCAFTRRRVMWSATAGGSTSRECGRWPAAAAGNLLKIAPRVCGGAKSRGLLGSDNRRRRPDAFGVTEAGRK